MTITDLYFGLKMKIRKRTINYLTWLTVNAIQFMD